MKNLTPDGKIQTIRCVTATHADFEKLVNLGKKVIQDIGRMERISGCTLEMLQQRLEDKNYESVKFEDGTIHPVIEVFSGFLEKTAELNAYKNAYHVLMEEGVDELLASIDIEAESYDYDFYELCLEF